MVSKKILGAAIAAAFVSQSAFAVIDGTTANNVLYAKETILSSDISAVSATSGLVNALASAAGNASELTMTVPLGFGVSANNHAFVRFDLTNAKFNVAIASADLTTATAGSVVTLAQGGAVGDTYVIFDITAPAGGLLQAEVLKFAPGVTNQAASKASLAISPSAAVSVAYHHYSTSPAAVANSGGHLSEKTLSSAVSIIDDLKTTIAAGGDLTADVNAATPFKAFTVGATGSLGSVKFEYADATARMPSTGALANTVALFDTAAGKSSLVVSGDLSFTSANAGATAAADTAHNLTFGGVDSDASATATSTTPTGKLTTLTNAAFNMGAAVAPINVTSNGIINAGAYSLTFTPGKLTGREYTPAVVSKALASIVRNGATAQVPYLTTNAGLNQKVVLVNRGASATTYSVTFTPESGVTATAGTAATGTLAAKQTKVLKATDLVTLTGGTRTAATVVVLAPVGNIDAATQTVVTDPASVSFGSNDTVNLDVK